MESRRAKGSVSSFHWTIRVRARSERFLYDGAVTYPHGGSQGLLKVGVGGDMKNEVVAK